MPASTRKRRRVGSARSARGSVATERAATAGKAERLRQRPLSARTNCTGAAHPRKRPRTKVRVKPTPAEVNAIAAHPSLGFGHLRINPHAEAWQPRGPAPKEHSDHAEPSRCTGDLLPTRLKPPSQLELELAERSGEDIAVARAARMPWLTGVAEKVRTEKAAEAERRRVRHEDLNRKVRGAAVSGGVFGGAFSAARQTKQEAERAEREQKARKQRELAKLQKRRENKRLRKQL